MKRITMWYHLWRHRVLCRVFGAKYAVTPAGNYICETCHLQKRWRYNRAC